MEGAAVSSTCSAIFPTILEHLCSCVNYKDIAEELKRNMDLLAAAKADMERTVEAEEIGHRQERTANVETWTRTVNDIQVKVEKFYASYNSRSTPCLASCWKRYRLGRKASHLLKQVQEWRSHEAKMLEHPLVAPAQPSRVEDLPCPPTAVARSTKMLEEVLVHLSDGEVNTVGIYGMGGSGKTTLLKQINKELQIKGTDFDLVIWVEVHREFDVKDIQDQVAKRVGLHFGNEDEGARAGALSEALSRVKFLLLLDDVWKRVDLDEIGIPRLTGSNHCKMVLTTRTLDVCGDMEVQKRIKMKLLDGKQSWELFKQKLNDDNLLDSPAIRPYAESIVERCGGLPLALITVGGAMSIHKTADEWKWSDAQMRRSFNEIRGMGELIKSLQFTFEQLEDRVKRCFLYGALLPNYEIIPTEDLINWWIGEGFLGADDYSIIEARLEGRIIIRKLISACLLEPIAWNSIVRIHDVVHDMASSMSQPGEEFCTLQHNRDGSSSNLQTSDVNYMPGKRICIRTSDVNYMPADDEKLECPNLQTLILNDSSKIKRFPNDDFFLFMPLLRVLDLFLSSITELPSSVGSLVELRHLNLSRTHIRSLPSELGKATKLRTLNLTDTVYLEEIPCRAISGLVMLQELDMSRCGYDWVLMETLFEQPSLSLLRSSPEASADASREAPYLIRDLDRLRHLERLECLGITVKSSPALELILRYPECASTITSLCIGGDDSIDANHLFSEFTKFSNMRRLVVHNLSQLLTLSLREKVLQSIELLELADLPISSISCESGLSTCETGPSRPPMDGLYLLHTLKELTIVRCNSLKDLNSITRLPCLENLAVLECDEIEELVNGQEHQTTEDTYGKRWPFHDLQILIISNLPKLTIISRKDPLPFPSLSNFAIVKCPLVKKLPLGKRSAGNLQAIGCSLEHWNGLQWDDDNTRKSFQSYLSVIDFESFTPWPNYAERLA